MTSADTLLPTAGGADSDRRRARPGAATAAVGAKARRMRRGPFRPEVWLNTRQRAAARQRVYYFRGLDILAAGAVTLVAVDQVAEGGLAGARLLEAAPILAGGLIALGLMRSLGLYKFDRDRDPIRHLASVAAVVAAAGAAACALGLILLGKDAPLASYGRWTVATLGLLTALHSMWRLLVARWRRRGDLTPNIAVVGATRHAERLIQEALDRRDLNVLGVFDDRLARTPESIAGVPVLGEAAALLNHRLTPYLDRIVLAIDPRAEARVRDLTARLGALPIPLTLLVDPKGADQRNAALEKLARTPMPMLGGVIDPERRAFNKRLQDMALSSVALVLLAPLLLMIGLMVRLDSPGPALFRQRRHGFNQEEIVVWKFRTMRHDAADASASRQVTADDDRVTRIGRILRATSLDELPQLLNVLRGEMSLVGPRPHAIGMKTGATESARLVADYAHRHRIKPGMTGWAAIKGSRGPLHTAADVRRRVQLDVDYIERQSFWLDLWIIAVTIPVLLGDRMAIR
ncbi:exopolysaccharide biosynthesis polyprenyl glycosylphosphotransferase [Brevundimonas naejangsanensis]|uniref:Exopolysaccharide biosynthesis polyprenyl glycosylphosphotransferase n=1 Tax=Brevundimonas naejangsanensis TaxID=588932 RepID=A0A494RRK4_9CAUL|nr:exopolysaccharide biosynthesis polyprenyl glycosylphosphotransferase [Brevundimonas naejangsanensis]AYG96144.1 exopolysaccharide biosynthesis polyprenyl glycosylphosphotransferase [Brevundimonas naejangsanensis]